MATIKQMSNTRSWEGVEQRAHSDIDCEGVKWYIRFGKLALPYEVKHTLNQMT